MKHSAANRQLSWSSKSCIVTTSWVLCSLFPGLAAGGAYIYSENLNNPDNVTHPSVYTGNGGVLTVRICIDPTSPNATHMEIPVQNNINIYNKLQPTTGNIVLAGANNIPANYFDFESVSLHEIGHCLGMAHPNLASESGLTGDDRNYTKSTIGNDSTYTINPGADVITGSSDDIRGDDVNLHWFRKSNNNPFTIANVVDASTYSRDPGDLPGSHNFAANAARFVGNLLGVQNTEAVMQQGTSRDEAQRTLNHDDVATLRYAASGIDETSGNADDYTIQLEYGGISSSNCDISLKITTTPNLAFCSYVIPPTALSANHVQMRSPTIEFGSGFNWFFNTTTVNQMPVLSTIGAQALDEGQSLSVPVSATDVDGDNLIFTAFGLPPFATLTGPGNGNATLDINPGTGDTGTYTVKIDVDDDGLPVLGNSETFDIIVTTPVIDTDGDGIDDATEVLNGTDPDQVDSDGDGLVDGASGIVCINLVTGCTVSYPTGVDYDGDNFVDGESDLGTDPTLADSDTDQLPDGLEVELGSDPLSDLSWPNIADGDLAPLGNPDGNVNAADLLIAMRIVLNEVTPLSLQFAHGDLYPHGAPDGVIDLSDVLLLQQQVLGPP